MILAAITTCKRKPEMVERAVKSVIAQTYTDWNLVVVDDSPADYEFREDVRKMVESYAAQDERIRYVPHDRNYGAQRARNTALKIATDEDIEYIAYLDDDDEWLPEKLEKQLARFEECGDDVGLVYCKTIVVLYRHDVEVGKFPYRLYGGIHMYEGKVYDKMIMRNLAGTTSNPLIRTTYLREIGGFDEQISAFQDWETWIRVSKRYSFACVDEGLILWSWYEGEHISFNSTARAKTIEAIISKNKDYLVNNKLAYWNILATLSETYMQSGYYRRGFRIWLKAVSLQPMKFIANIKCLILVLLNGLKQPILRYPKLYWVVKSLRGKFIGSRV